MGIWSSIKSFFRGTRNAAAPLFKEAKRTVTRRRRAAAPTGLSSAERRAQKKRSNAWIAAKAKKDAAAAEQQKKEAARAISTDKFKRDFEGSLSALAKGKVKTPKRVSAKKGSVRKPAKVRSESPKSANSVVRRGSLRVRKGDWELIPVNLTDPYAFGSNESFKRAFPANPSAKSKKAYTPRQIEINLAQIFGPAAKPFPKLPAPPTGRTRKRRVSPPKKRVPSPFNTLPAANNGIDAF
jgi:hypothetical protein